MTAAGPGRAGWMVRAGTLAAGGALAAVLAGLPVSARTPKVTVAPAPAVTVPAPLITPAPALPQPAAPPADTPAPSPASNTATPAAPAALSTVVSGPPADPRLAQVYSVFEGHCASCHQTGKLTRAAPAGGLANVLDLEELAREPHLVARGAPDASRLYQVLLERHRPADLGADPNWPGADDIQRVRTWIEELPPRPSTCDVAAPRTAAEVAAVIDEAARAAGEAEAIELRFVSLAHLARACATPAEMEGYRQGVVKLLNSLSWGAHPVALTPVDVGKTLLSFRLSDLGWIDEHWTALARAEPRGIALDLAGLMTAPGANGRPIRADWLAWAASQPAFYGELLGLPPSVEETQRLLGIRREGDSGVVRPLRAAVRSSAITRGPRVIERDQADQRRLWRVFDLLDGSGDRDVFERPLGGVTGAPERAQFRADGQRMIFTLPNGFLAFAVLDADGRRIDQLPQRLEVDGARGLAPTAAGLACLGCHVTGLKPVTDGMRAHLSSDKFTGGRDIRDQALAIYEQANEWNRLLDDDSYRFRRALIQSGVDPDLLLHGLEPVTALARRYTLGVGMESAAAEAGVDRATYDRLLDAARIGDRTLVLRQRQGLLARVEANRLLAAVKSAAESEPGLAVALPPATTSLKLDLWSDRARYKPGELLTVFARPSAPCHLTLISVNASGKATVLFPNEFDPDNLVNPDTALAVPAEKAQYQFRLKDPGAETVIGACHTVARFPPGIEPDYERQRFTVLGNYENFVRASIDLETEAQHAAPKLDKPRVQRGAVKDPKADAKPEQTAHAAVRIVIE